MDVTIVSVNYKSKEHIVRMVESAKARLSDIDYEIILVNNDVKEDISDLRADNITVINLNKNYGFARASNRGIEKATGRYVALINPDVIFVSNSLKQMVNHLDEDSDVAIAGPKLLYPGGKWQPSTRRFPKILDQLIIMLKIPHVIRGISVVNQYLMTDFNPDKTQDVDQIMGAYFVIRRSAIDKIGALDPKYFIWFEEVDLCKRAKDAGYQVRYYADVNAEHVHGASFAKEKTIKKQAVIRRSLRRYMRKHFGIKGWVVFALFDPLFRALAVAAHIIKRK